MALKRWGGGGGGGSERESRDQQQTHARTHAGAHALTISYLVINECDIVGAKFLRGCTFACMCEELTQASQKKDGEESEDSGEEEEGGGTKKSMCPFILHCTLTEIFYLCRALQPISRCRVADDVLPRATDVRRDRRSRERRRRDRDRSYISPLSALHPPPSYNHPAFRNLLPRTPHDFRLWPGSGGRKRSRQRGRGRRTRRLTTRSWTSMSRQLRWKTTTGRCPCRRMRVESARMERRGSSTNSGNTMRTISSRSAVSLMPTTLAKIISSCCSQAMEAT